MTLSKAPPGSDAASALSAAASLLERFGDTLTVSPKVSGLATIARVASRFVYRHYSERTFDAGLIRLRCALAVSAPSKSDLQQRDIVVIHDAKVRAAIADLIPHVPWVRAAPVFLVFCADGACEGRADFGAYVRDTGFILD